MGRNTAWQTAAGCIGMTKSNMQTRLLCGRLWGRRTGNWFCTAFPTYRRTDVLLFDSARAVALDPMVWAWLTENGFI